jgi:DNA-binding NtrC family response regulator
MPGLSGLETLKRIKADNPEVHVVFLSAQENMDVALVALRYGAFDFIIKDYESLLRLPIILARLAELEKLLEEQKKKNKIGNIARSLILLGVLALLALAA